VTASRFLEIPQKFPVPNHHFRNFKDLNPNPNLIQAVTQTLSPQPNPNPNSNDNNKPNLNSKILPV